MSNFTEDLSCFFDDDEFAASVTWNAATFSGQLENAFIESGDSGMESRAPVLTVADSNVVGITQGDAITVDGTAYVVVEIQPDATGLTDLIMNLA